MPRTKGSKNKPKTATADFALQIAEKQSAREALSAEIASIRLTAADFLEKLEAAVAERSAERMTAMQYAEKLIADREQEKTIFDDEQRNLIVNFAFKLDDRAATEELVNGLAAALAEDDKEEANRLMYDAQEKIENLPDGMIGLSEMHDYGYLHDDVLPLTKEGAREWHRLGERIYPLFRDGTVGDYVSQEEIEQHDGIFGIKADAWDAILLEQREDYAENEYSYRNNGLETASYISENSPFRPMSSLGQLFSQINLKNRKKISPTRFSVGSEPI